MALSAMRHRPQRHQQYRCRTPRARCCIQLIGQRSLADHAEFDLVRRRLCSPPSDMSAVSLKSCGYAANGILSRAPQCGSRVFVVLR